MATTVQKYLFAPINAAYTYNNSTWMLPMALATKLVVDTASVKKPIVVGGKIQWVLDGILLENVVGEVQFVIEGNYLYGLVTFMSHFEHSVETPLLHMCGVKKSTAFYGEMGGAWEDIVFLEAFGDQKHATPRFELVSPVADAPIDLTDSERRIYWSNKVSIYNPLQEKGTMQQYKDLVANVYKNGRIKGDRTGTGTLSVFGAQMRFDLTKGFPLNTLKSTPLYLIANELIWFLSGSTDDRDLARMDRIHREAVKTSKERAKADEVGQLTLLQYFFGCMPRDASVETQQQTLACFYVLHPQYNKPHVELTLRVIGAVIRYLVSRDLYVWLYELADKPTIWDEWATYNTNYCREQLHWVVDRTENAPEVAEEAAAISAKFKNWDGAIAEKNKWFYETVVALSEKHQVAIGDLVHRRTIGPMYGKQWRSFSDYEVDQITKAIKTLRDNPTSRRICISAWDPTLLPMDGFTPHENVDRGDMALAPCHAFFQFNAEELTREELMSMEKVQIETAYCAPEALGSYIADKQLQGKIPKYRLSCQVYCRSQDLFLGTPFNIASYALLTHMVAAEVGMEVGDLVWTGGDVHLYSNHLEQVQEMLSRDCGALPTLILHKEDSGYMELQSTDMELIGYNPHPAISAPVAI